MDSNNMIKYSDSTLSFQFIDHIRIFFAITSTKSCIFNIANQNVCPVYVCTWKFMQNKSKI